jgi:hypothetical protein
MDSLSLASLALQLLASIHSLSGYPTTRILPEIHQVPLVEIQQRFCQGQCAAQAFYKPGEGVYVDEAFNLANDEFARSVLLHELVHMCSGSPARSRKSLRSATAGLRPSATPMKSRTATWKRCMTLIVSMSMHGERAATIDEPAPLLM